MNNSLTEANGVEWATVACNAMATRFEMAVWGDGMGRMRAAAEEAIEEIHRLDRQLSIYRSDSDMREINVMAHREWVQLDPRVFSLLLQARHLSESTDGAFDIAMGPLMAAWGFLESSGCLPATEQIDVALSVCGMHLLEVNESDCSIHFRKAGVMLDLGAIGKGYAIEKACQILKDCGIGGALIHGGTSTIQAVGAKPDGSPWTIPIRHPDHADATIATVDLLDSSLSVSAVHGKSFTLDGVTYGHVIDPRTGRPSTGVRMAAASGPSATETDAISTAFLILGGDRTAEFTNCHPHLAILTVDETDSGETTIRSSGAPFTTT